MTSRDPSRLGYEIPDEVRLENMASPYCCSRCNFTDDLYWSKIKPSSWQMVIEGYARPGRTEPPSTCCCTFDFRFQPIQVNGERALWSDGGFVVLYNKL